MKVQTEPTCNIKYCGTSGTISSTEGKFHSHNAKGKQWKIYFTFTVLVILQKVFPLIPTHHDLMVDDFTILFFFDVLLFK